MKFEIKFDLFYFIKDIYLHLLKYFVKKFKVFKLLFYSPGQQCSAGARVINFFRKIFNFLFILSYYSTIENHRTIIRMLKIFVLIKSKNCL